MENGVNTVVSLDFKENVMPISEVPEKQACK